MSEWINFVKGVAKEKGLKYNEALKISSKLYHEKKGTKPKPKKPPSNSKRLTGKRILKNLKKKIDSGEIHKGLSKKKMVEILKN